MENVLTGRRIVLTGVSRGVGFETAKLLLAKGAKIFGVARDAERLEAARAVLEPMGDFVGLAKDVGDANAAPEIADAVARRWDALDVLVNNAAILVWKKDFEDEGPSVLERSLRVNVLGPHWLILALLPLLKKGTEPRVINVSSGAGRLDSVKNDATMPSYRLSKYALNGMTMSYAKALAGSVAVNSLDPGWLKTDMGGSEAPGVAADGARRIFELLQKPHSESGKFWYGAEEIGF